MRRVALATAMLLAAIAAAHAEVVLVEFGSPMRYLANAEDPGLATAWTQELFDATGWPTGTYGVGYETAPPGASSLIQTTTPAGTRSIYTRAQFQIADRASIGSLRFGADYDDGYVAWINGVEVARSPSMPAGDPPWNAAPGSHESSNGASPNYGALIDITAAALPALHDGQNVLVVGVWNTSASSSDLVLVPRLVTDCSTPVTRGPYLQLGTPNGVTLRWRTATPTIGRVRYGDAPGNLAQSIDEPGAVTEHEIAIGGLTPTTQVYYAVGTAAETCAGGDARHFFVTAPPTGSTAPLRAWVIGDSGTGTGAALAVRDAYASFTAGKHTNLWVLLGDNAYPNGTDDEYQATFFDIYPDLLRQSVVWPTLGNHDGHSADSATQSGPYYDIFTLPRLGEAGGLASGTEAYYSFDWGNVHFICLESYETDRAPSGAMLTWAQMDALSSTSDWVIAFWHHPPYSKGSHDSDTDPTMSEMRANALPLLESAGVDLVLTGHSHAYERSVLLDGHYGTSTTLTAAMKLDSGDGRVDGAGAYRKPTAGGAAHEGTVYVVAGSAGQADGGPLNHPAMFLSLNELGSLVLDVHGRQLEAQFLDDAGVVRDHFTLAKGPPTPPVAEFTGSPRTGPTPLSVQFSDLTSNDPSQWRWDFEADGSIDSNLKDPSHVYLTTGAHSVQLAALSGFGSDTRTKLGYVCVTSGDGTGDQDADGAQDALDCAPCDDSAVAPPPDVGPSVLVGPAKDQIHWSGAPGIGSWNVYRGTHDGSATFVYNHTCLEGRSADTVSADTSTPLPGTYSYYLVAAVNACGEGTLGSGTAGQPRTSGSACP